MSIDYTLLGALLETPSHGYSLKKYLAERVSRDFGLNDGQLYPALARLEGRGWISKRVVRQRRSPTKHHYRVTPDGEQAFYDWLEGAEGEAGPRYDFYCKHEFLQRLSFFRYLEPARVRAQVARRIGEAQRRVDDLEGVLAQMRRDGTDPYRCMVTEFGVRYQRMRLDWLQTLARVAEQPDQEGERNVRLGRGR